jgi:hypothetical protein
MPQDAYNSPHDTAASFVKLAALEYTRRMVETSSECLTLAWIGQIEKPQRPATFLSSAHLI